jgi:hypothetical protein
LAFPLSRTQVKQRYVFDNKKQLDFMDKTKSRSQHIFIAYSHEDSWEMRAIYNELRLAGFCVWIDKDLTPGSKNWQQETANMLDMAACVICICSPHAKASPWVNIELELANQREIIIYPLLTSGDQRDAIPTSLSLAQFTDFRGEYCASITKLIEELTKHHESALIFDMRSIFDTQGIKWTYFGSLFWFASEVRKLRLFFLPETPNIERIKDSLRQLLHHAKRLNVDKFTLRDINYVITSIDSSDFALMSDKDREDLENKLRLVQDKVGVLAENVDLSFTDGPRPGKPIVRNKPSAVDDNILDERVAISTDKQITQSRYNSNIPIINTNVTLINHNSPSETKNNPVSFNNDLQGANIANFANEVRDNARQQANQYNYTSEQEQTLTKAAAEIQKLLRQLDESYPTATDNEKVAYINDETSPSFKRRVVGALQTGGGAVIDEFILENKYLKVIKEAIKGWFQPDD